MLIRTEGQFNKNYNKKNHFKWGGYDTLKSGVREILKQKHTHMS